MNKLSGLVNQLQPRELSALTFALNTYLQKGAGAQARTVVVTPQSDVRQKLAAIKAQSFNAIMKSPEKRIETLLVLKELEEQGVSLPRQIYTEDGVLRSAGRKKMTDAEWKGYMSYIESQLE